MTRRSSFSFPHSRGLRVTPGLVLALIGPALVTACLTPDFVFKDDTGVNVGGANTSDSAGDGDGDGLPTGGTGGDGDGDSGGDGDGDTPMGGQGSLPNHCANGVTDAGRETDRDCGGECEPCRSGRACVVDSDCRNESCISDVCQEPSCRDDALSPGEADVDCGGDDCQPCDAGDDCDVDDDCESRNCQSGICASATCEDEIQNGNELGVDCGGGSCEGCDSGFPCGNVDDCLQPPLEDPAVAQCVNNVCELDCTDTEQDCNQTVVDGCEVDTNVDLDHCGACGAICDPANAIGECLAGQCLIKADEPNQGCDVNYANCNLDHGDGCEVYLLTDPDHCGACEDSACSSNHGTPACAAGQCSIECDEGFDDCDENARDNGCEIDLNANAKHCGSCDHDCPDGSGDQSPFCLDGVCDLADCAMGLGDCDGDGVCTDVLTTVANCGGCGESCTVANGTPSCSPQGDCLVSTCTATTDQVWADCDQQYVNGCEVNVNSNRLRCGGCLSSDPSGGSGEDCSVLENQPSAHVSATGCDQGACSVASCDSGFGDCDGVFGNGCDTDLTSDSQACGDCATNCEDSIDSFDIDAVQCVNGSCEVDSCADSMADCDGAFSNGCELDTSDNVNHCGGCNQNANNPGSGENCTASIGTDSVSGVDCVGGSCEVTSCSGARRDCDGDFENGCEVNINSNSTHCGGCAGDDGESCDPKPHATGSCGSGDCVYTCQSGWLDLNNDRNVDIDSDGCETRNLTILNAGTFGSWDAASGGDLRIAHQLQGDPGTQRLLLVGVVLRGDSTTGTTLTSAQYGSTTLTLLGQSNEANNARAQIYYALDASLPAAGTNTLILDKPTGWGAVVAEIVEFSGAKQSGFSQAVASATGGNCDTAIPDVTGSLASLPSLSAIYAVGGGFGLNGTTSVSAPLSNSIQSQFNHSLLFGSGTATAQSGTQPVTINLTGCYASVMYAVGIRPEN